MIPVLVVFGPTASGKTALAERLFSAPGPYAHTAEIISADSMQVYRGLDIGTAKPNPELLSRLPHHLIDIVDPREQFCAGDFVRLADQACKDIHDRGKLPVVLGGTAFYIRNFLFGLPDTPESDPGIRLRIKSRMALEGADRLWTELSRVDPESASRINPHDEYRIIRALEVYETSGRPRSDFQRELRLRGEYRFLAVSLVRPREELYRRIEERVDLMLEQGLEGEVRALIDSGLGPQDPGMQAIGYREFFLTDPPGSDMNLIREQIIRNSKKYAKRQETFIKALPGIIEVPAGDGPALGQLLDEFFISVHNYRT